MKLLLLLALLTTLACSDQTPVEPPFDWGTPAAGSWWGEAGDYSLTLDLKETYWTDSYWGLRWIELTGTGTYTHQPTQESSPLEAGGSRTWDNSNPPRPVQISMSWTDSSQTQQNPDGSTSERYLGGYEGTLVDSTRIEGAITGGC
jgi:hypothetical protein